MTPDDDFTGLLEGYLDEFEGMTPLPDAIRNAIRGRLPTTKQVGRFPGAMRYLNMSMSIPAPARYGLVAAVVVLAAVLGASLLGRGIGGPPNPTPTPTPLPVATPGALPEAASLQPGTYVYSNPYVDEDPVRSCERGCSDYRSITFTLPEGWATSDGLVFKHLGQPNEVAFSVWTPGGVYADPCHWQKSAVGPALDPVDPHTAITLQNQAGRKGSTPTETTLGGQRAFRIELSVPANLDIATCDQGEYRSWSEWDVPDGANSHHAAGQIDVVFAVDVDRRTLLIDASHMPGASGQDLAELEAILASMFIDRASGP
jgi:hypothetical protein